MCLAVLSDLVLIYYCIPGTFFFYQPVELSMAMYVMSDTFHIFISLSNSAFNTSVSVSDFVPIKLLRFTFVMFPLRLPFRFGSVV